MNIHDVLAELGHRMGLNVALDEQGVCRLVFDERFAVDIEASPDNDTVHLYSVLCPVPPENKEPFYERLLGAGKCKKAAMTACAHKLLRILNAMARSGKAWNPELHGFTA